MNLVPATFLSVWTKLYLPGTELPTYLETSTFPPVSFQRLPFCSFMSSFTFCFIMPYYGVYFPITIKVAFSICVCKTYRNLYEKKDKLSKPLTKSFFGMIQNRCIFTFLFCYGSVTPERFWLFVYFSHFVSVFPFQLLTSMFYYEVICFFPLFLSFHHCTFTF